MADSTGISDLLGLHCQFYVQAAASALVTYDTVLTLPSEIALVWRGNWSAPAVLYMLTRYITLIHSYVVVGFTPFIFGPSSLHLIADTYCALWGALFTCSIPIITLLAEALLTIRVIAFYGRKWQAAVFLWTIYSVCAATGITIMILGIHYTHPFLDARVGLACITGDLDGSSSCDSASASYLSCNDKNLTQWTWAYWAPGMVMEFVLIMATLARTFQFWSEGMQSPLLTLVTQDNLFYFCCVFALMVVNLGICATPNLNLEFAVIAELTLCINSMLASRIFLHLTTQMKRETTTDQETQEYVPTKTDQSRQPHPSHASSVDSWMTTPVVSMSDDP